MGRIGAAFWPIEFFVTPLTSRLINIYLAWADSRIPMKTILLASPLLPAMFDPGTGVPPSNIAARRLVAAINPT
jgi:hypothetical protein